MHLPNNSWVLIERGNAMSISSLHSAVVEMIDDIIEDDSQHDIKDQADRSIAPTTEAVVQQVFFDTMS